MEVSMKPNAQLAPTQIVLVEHALREITNISPSGWNAMPRHLQASFIKYMSKDPWTGQPDTATLTDAALMVVRDAISRRGEFAAEPRKVPSRLRAYSVGGAKSPDG